MYREQLLDPGAGFCRIAAIQFLGRDIVDEQGDIPPEHRRSFMPTTPPDVLGLPPDVQAVTKIRPQIMERYVRDSPP